MLVPFTTLEVGAHDDRRWDKLTLCHIKGDQKRLAVNAVVDRRGVSHSLNVILSMKSQSSSWSSPQTIAFSSLFCVNFRNEYMQGHQALSRSLFMP